MDDNKYYPKMRLIQPWIPGFRSTDECGVPREPHFSSKTHPY